MRKMYQYEADRESVVLRRSMFPHFVCALVFECKYQEWKAKVPELDRATCWRVFTDLSAEVIPSPAGRGGPSR